MKTDFTQDYGTFETDYQAAPEGWINIHMNPSYVMTTNSLAQGSSKVLIPTERVIDRAYRGFYVKTPNAIGSFPLDCQNYRCVHTLWDTTYYGQIGNIAISLRVFVPTSGSREIWTLTATNTGSICEQVDVFTAFAPEYGGMGTRAWFDPSANSVISYVHPYYIRYEEQEECDRQLLYCYLQSTSAPTSFDASESRFWGSARRNGIPDTVLQGWCTNTDAGYLQTVAALHHKRDIEPGQTQSISYFFGCAATAEEIQQLHTLEGTAETVEQLLAQTRAYWTGWTGNLWIETPDWEFNNIFNYWLQRQAVAMASGHRYSMLSCVRNELQDAMGISYLRQEEGWRQVLAVLCQQQPTGYLKQWHMLNDGFPERGLAKLHHLDGCVWLVLITSMVMKRIGNCTLLDDSVPYSDGSVETVRMHLIAAVRYLAKNRGAHGLCLFGDGDWTDPINGMGRKGSGESVWTTQAFCAAIHEFLTVLPQEDPLREELNDLSSQLHTSLHESAFAGDKFCLGYNDDGLQIGGEDALCFLNTQSWAVLAGELTDAEMAAVTQQFKNLDSDAGPRVLYPSQTAWHPSLGKLSVKAPGTSENGSVYCHAAMFKAYADCVNGKPDQALETVCRIMPIPSRDEFARKRQSPLFLPNYYFGLPNNPDFGASSGLHSTGTISWLFKIVVEQLVGVKMLREGLKVQPMLPKAWDHVTAHFLYRASSYDVTIKRGTAQSFTVNGVPYLQDFLPAERGQNYKIEIII